MGRHSLAILLCFVPLSLASAKPKSANTQVKAYDISAVKDRLRVIHDDKGHYLVFAPFPRCGDNQKVKDLSDFIFYGDGKKFFRLYSRGGGATCNVKFDFMFWDPRISRNYQKHVTFESGAYKVQCGERATAMQELPKKARQAILDKAKFHDRLWDRRPHRLARDDRGFYYMVDIRRDGSEHRMWIGPRGNMKLQKMRNIVSDSEGEIYATNKGQLRMVFNKSEISWISGKKRMTLVRVPVLKNVQMIYNDLGVYDERLGSPCDDL